MADFLTRVSQRAQGQAAAVRPIIAPMFAPPPVGGRAMQPAPASSLAQPFSEPEEIPFQTEREMRSLEHPPAPASLRRRSAFSAETEPAGLRPSAQPGTERDPWQTGEQSGLRPAQSEHPAAAMVRPASASAVEPERDTPLVPLQPTQGSFGPAQVQERPLAMPSAPQQPWPLRTRLESAQPVEPGRGDPLPRGPQAKEVSEPAPAPVIRVTIGRVEVRAMMPPPRQPARPAPSQPATTLSLEAFLKQRNGGER